MYKARSRVSRGIWIFSTFLLIFIVGISGFINGANASVTFNWVAQPTGTTEHLKAVYFIDNNTGWATGANGTVIKTTNGGSTWTPVNIGTNYTLNDVYFINTTEGWIVGDYGQIYHTSDAGAHWENQSISNLYILQNAYWLNGNVGFAGGLTGLFRTTNGGANWIKLGLNINGFFGMTFANDTCGWIVSSNGVYPVLYETTNAGANWTLKSTITQINIVNDIDYIEGLGIWIIGLITSGSKILLSTNYGNSFVDKTPSASFAGFWRIQFVSATDGWATGDTYVYRTTDAGTSWTKLYPDNDLVLSDFYAIDSVHAWAAGNNGKLVYSMGENSSETNNENNTENNTNEEKPSGLNGIPSFPTILIIFNITGTILIIERKIRKRSHNKA